MSVARADLAMHKNTFRGSPIEQAANGKSTILFVVNGIGAAANTKLIDITVCLTGWQFVPIIARRLRPLQFLRASPIAGDALLKFNLAQ